MSEETAGRLESKALFANLVMMLSTSAMQQLGMIANPMTNKAEMNLQGAQLSIDMLSMLRDKTTGNRDAEEDAMLNDVLASLQMNYVEAAKSTPAEAAAAEEQAAEAGAEAPGPEAEAEPTADKVSDGKEPKFHKSYGE